ncbi:MAG: hypothetical protein Q4D62_08890 [Planctomycetia bacterium]|nr:hypothetical protein [Planctomycetia bacterium]
MRKFLETTGLGIASLKNSYGPKESFTLPPCQCVAFDEDEENPWDEEDDEEWADDEDDEEDEWDDEDDDWDDEDDDWEDDEEDDE